MAMQRLIHGSRDQGNSGSFGVVVDICISNQKLKVPTIQNQAAVQLQGIQDA